MGKLQPTIRAALASMLLIPLILLYPAVAIAAESSPKSDNQSTTTENAGNNQGPQQPTGADGTAYHYNEATGLWENDYYTWNPATNQTQPKTPQDYSYNPSTQMWDTTEWRYDAPNGQYVPNTVSTVDPPANSQKKDDSTTELAPSQSSLTSMDSSNISTNNSADHAFDLFYNAQISNTIVSSAVTGNALVRQNTAAGDAITGNAQAVANILNLLQSSWNPDADDIATFVANIDGSVVGDLYIDPGQIAQPDLAVSQSSDNDININAVNNGQINNHITLDANSGNAAVDSNTSAGNAMSGSANAVGNIVNMINSAIAAGKSFVGTVNINGNLEGDILLPEDLITQLLASNDVPRATIDTTRIENSQLLANFADNQTVNNVVYTNAASGGAMVADNTSAGNASTGNALTNLTVLNLTGRQIIGNNALLVFVNVLGEWVGLIMNAPAGSTAAALSDGNARNTLITATEATVNATTDSRVNNDISVNARSGDAYVTNNTQAGDARSGDATASVNIANILDSQFSLSDWFGILFINVFGSWRGSFGVNTAFGNSIATPTSPTNVSGDQNVRVFRFVPKNDTGYRIVSVSDNDKNDLIASAASQAYTPPSNPQILGASSDNNPSDYTNDTSGFNWFIPVVALIFGGAFLSGEWFFAGLRTRFLNWL